MRAVSDVALDDTPSWWLWADETRAYWSGWAVNHGERRFRACAHPRHDAELEAAGAADHRPARRRRSSARPLTHEELTRLLFARIDSAA